MDQQHIEDLVKAAFWKLLGRKTFIQGRGLIERLAKVTGLEELAVQGALIGLENSRWLDGVHGGIPTGRVTLLTERPADLPPPSLLRWEASLTDSGLGDEDQTALLPLHDALEDFTRDDHLHLIRGLVRLRSELTAQSGRPSFLVSAEYLLGSSKLLDALPTSALRQFGIDKSLFPGAPPVLLVAGPADPENVVLVENPHAFWKAVTTEAVKTTAFIVTFGYGLSRHGDEYGNQLASILESGGAVTGAVCAGSPPHVSELLRHHNISFWGDLDVEALRIYLRLKKIIPQLGLSALYKPMLQAVEQPGCSHPYVKAAAKDKQSRMELQGCDIAPSLLQLLEACSERAVDQELISQEDILSFSGGVQIS